jgi:ABC-type uncharacterized transport system substrate-binding protein
MKNFLAALLLGLLAVPTLAHPHEWVDWSVGLVVEEKSPSVLGPPVARALQLELTWDSVLSALILADFPQIKTSTMRPADLTMLDNTYGLASSLRASSLAVSWKGKPVKLPKPVPLPPVAGAKTVTLVYSLPLGLRIDSPGELRVSLYDPTYYTDMGISAKKGAFFLGVKDAAKYQNSFAFEQDFDHPYYGGVFPEVVVFHLENR